MAENFEILNREKQRTLITYRYTVSYDGKEYTFTVQTMNGRLTGTATTGIYTSSQEYLKLPKEAREQHFEAIRQNLKRKQNELLR